MPVVTGLFSALMMALAPHGQGLPARTFDTPVDTPTVQIRVAQATPGEGFVRMHSMVPDQSVFVHGRDIVSDDDIEWIAATITPRGALLNVQLSEEGAARLAEASAVAFTRGLQLAVIIRGRLAAAMRGAAPMKLTDGRLHIGLSIPPPEAAEVVAAIAARWPAAER